VSGRSRYYTEVGERPQGRRDERGGRECVSRLNAVVTLAISWFLERKIAIVLSLVTNREFVDVGALVEQRITIDELLYYIELY
jgi:hypothetical protein